MDDEGKGTCSLCSTAESIAVFQDLTVWAAAGPEATEKAVGREGAVTSQSNYLNTELQILELF